MDVVSNTEGQMSGILIRNVNTKEESDLDAKGLFYGIGHSPNSQLLEGQVDLDAAVYIWIDEGSANTSVEGVFAAGDVQDHEWRQAVTAAGSGCVATLSVERYLTSKGLLIEFHQYASRKLYPESQRIACVLCTAPTCGPCRTLKPILSKSVHLVEIDIEEDPEIAEAAGIMGTPYVQFFKNKEMLKTVSGVKMKKEYRELIEANK